MTDSVPHWVIAAALAGLPGMGPARLRALLDRLPPDRAWRAATTGVGLPGGVVGGKDATAWPAAWAAAAATIDLFQVWDTHRRAGIVGVLRGAEGYPVALADDHQAPAMLFLRGAAGALERPAVAIVGTRRCTAEGRAVAAQLGHDLAAAGVAVVSGLALGIDGAAHQGALLAGAARPVGVVGSGLDVVYPRRHRALWDEVAAVGVLLSESPAGTAPEAWRFPLRNRIIAALAQVVVVVESHEAGGSLHTVDAAITRGRTVLAVPGPVRSAASSGTNRLLFDGIGPARDAADVLSALGLCDPRPPQPGVARPPVTTAAPCPPASHALCPEGPSAVDDERVAHALGGGANHLDDLVACTDLPPLRVAAALSRLEGAGRAAGRGGWWSAGPEAPGARAGQGGR